MVIELIVCGRNDKGEKVVKMQPQPFTEGGRINTGETAPHHEIEVKLREERGKQLILFTYPSDINRPTPPITVDGGEVVLVRGHAILARRK